MKPVTQMFTYINPFNTCSEVLEAAKQVAFETKYIRSMTGLEAWEQSHLDIINIVRPALSSNVYTGKDYDNLYQAKLILDHAINVKVPQIVNERNI